MIFTKEVNMHSALKTPICSLLGIEKPIFQAGMGFVARSELAAAVSEAGALGALGVIVDGLVRRKLGRAAFVTSLKDSGQLTVMILTVIFGAILFSRFLVLAGTSERIIAAITALPANRFIILTGFLLMYVVLGMFLDGLAMMAITLPTVLPILIALGFSPLWFGIIMIALTEVGLITPPVAFSVYVLKSVAKDIPITDIFRGVIPFILVELVTIGILTAFPMIVLWLPQSMVR